MKTEVVLHSLYLKKAILIEELHTELLVSARNKVYKKLGMLEFRISVHKKQSLAAVKNSTD